MTTYRLHEKLGGAEVKLVNGETGHWSEAWVELVDTPGFRVCVSDRHITAVKPPPEEPPHGAIRLVRGNGNRHDCAWLHAGGGWYGTTYDRPRVWAELLAMDPDPQPLIPAPGPVELPWVYVDREHCAAQVNESPRSWGACRINSENGDPVDLTAEAAEDMAQVLWSAAARLREAPDA